MAEEILEYKLVTSLEQKTLNTSKDFTGAGIAYYPNGDTYEGMFVEGLRDGDTGTYTYHNLNKDKANEEEKAPSEVYVGNWKNN